MSAPSDAFDRGRHDAEQQDTPGLLLALLYMVAFFGAIIASHLWPQRWWQ